jgi:hypothetical protein
MALYEYEMFVVDGVKSVVVILKASTYTSSFDTEFVVDETELAFKK